MSYPRASASICCVSALDACLRRRAPHRPARLPGRYPHSRSQLHRVTQVETASPTRPGVLRRRHPMPSGTVSPVSPSCRRAPCGVRPKAHAPIRHGAAMAGSGRRTRHRRSAPVGPTPVGLSHHGKEPMHQNRTARWAAEQLAGRITTAGGAAQKRQAGQARQWNHRCTPMHTDGPESGMLVRSQTQPAVPGEQGRRVGPAPSVCICVHLWFHFLAALPRAAPCPKRSRIALRGKTPCTCAVARPAPPAASPSVQRDDGETRPRPARPIFRLTTAANICYYS